MEIQDPIDVRRADLDTGRIRIDRQFPVHRQLDDRCDDNGHCLTRRMFHIILQIQGSGTEACEGQDHQRGRESASLLHRKG